MVASNYVRVFVDTTGKDVFEVVKMLEELFNLLNICNHADNAVSEFIKIFHSIYDDLPNIQMIGLPSITAGMKHLTNCILLIL